MKKIAKNLGIALIVFVLVVLTGVLAWQYSSQWRAEKSGEYLANSARLVEEGSEEALWEIEKAYWMGMDYSDYRLYRAIRMMELEDVRAEKESQFLINKGIGNDDFNFLYANKLFGEGNYIESEQYLIRVENNLSSKYQDRFDEMMAYVYGLHGDWEQADLYVVGEEGELANNMNIALHLINDNIEEIELDELSDDLKLKIELLNESNADLYILRLADLMNSLKLPAWGRVVLDNVDMEGVLDRDMLIVYARSLLLDDMCEEALDYYLKAESLDSTYIEIHEGLRDVYQCLGENEWNVQEKMIIEGLE